MKLLSGLMSALIFMTFCGTAVAGGVTESEVARWLDGYENAWENRDADKAASLFTQNATYRDNPHNPPHEGREGIHEYWSNVTSDQRDVDFNYEVLTAYDNTAVATWSATFASASSGATVNLDGIFVLDFNDAGLCSRLREWWHVKVDKASDE